jgi:hypothetical protein
MLRPYVHVLYLPPNLESGDLNVLMLILRLAHVVTGAVWVGMMWMTTFWVIPAIREAGPEGGKVMLGLQRRRLMVAMPVMGLVTIAAGFWLFVRLAGGNQTALMRTALGQAYAGGATAAIVAFLIGVFGTRPIMMKAIKLADSLPALPPDQRAPQAAELERLRARGLALSRVVAVLLVLALAAMAVARYL